MVQKNLDAGCPLKYPIIKKEVIKIIGIKFLLNFLKRTKYNKIPIPKAFVIVEKLSGIIIPKIISLLLPALIK